MKKKINCYLVFTSRLYRVVTFLIVPLAILGLQIFLSKALDLFLVGYLTIFLLAPAEVILDYWAFGGIAAKNAGQLEYLKTSVRGMSVVKTALVVDMARQFLSCLFVMALGAAVCLGRNGMSLFGTRELICLIDMLLLEYFFVMAELMVTRCLDGPMMNVGVATFGSLLMLGGVMLIASQVYVMLAVLVIFSAAAGVAGVKLVMKRMKEGYYDKAA